MPLVPKLTKFTTVSPFVITADFLDTITGVSYIKFHCLGTRNEAGLQYSLTNNSTLNSDELNAQVTGAGVANSDFDFDIKILKPFTVAATDAIVQATNSTPSSNTIFAVYNVIHVDSADVETNIGTVDAADLNGALDQLNVLLIPMTRKRFAKGDKLRFNLINNSSATSSIVYWGGGGGAYAQTATLPNFTKDTNILLPIEVDF